MTIFVNVNHGVMGLSFFYFLVHTSLKERH